MDRMLRNKRSVFAFVTPGFLALTLFLVLPLIISIVLSFFETDLLTKMEYVGFGNYTRMFNDSEFWKATARSWYLCVLAVLCDTILGLIVALLMTLLPKRAQRFFRIAFLVPMVISISVIAQLWVFIFDPSFGLLNFWSGRMESCLVIGRKFCPFLCGLCGHVAVLRIIGSYDVCRH